MSKNLIPQIGRKIRAIRTQQSLSIQEVADRSKITKGMLSKIENGRSIASLPVLLNVVRSLKVDFSHFFQGIYLDSDQRFIHTREKDLTPIEKEINNEHYIYQNAFSSNISAETMDVVILTIYPGSKRELVTTDAFELKYMIQGSIDYYLEDELIELNKGDFLYYDGRIPHVPINTSKEVAVMLVVYFFNSIK